MFGISMTQLLIIFAIVLLLFGSKKLKTLGSDLGHAIKGFKQELSENEKCGEANKALGQIEKDIKVAKNEVFQEHK